jgi:hypothetical protein
MWNTLEQLCYTATWVNEEKHKVLVDGELPVQSMCL